MQSICTTCNKIPNQHILKTTTIFLLNSENYFTPEIFLLSVCLHLKTHLLQWIFLFVCVCAFKFKKYLLTHFTWVESEWGSDESLWSWLIMTFPKKTLLRCRIYSDSSDWTPIPNCSEPSRRPPAFYSPIEYGNWKITWKPPEEISAMCFLFVIAYAWCIFCYRKNCRQ